MRRNIPEGGILHIHPRENLKSHLVTPNSRTKSIGGKSQIADTSYTHHSPLTQHRDLPPRYCDWARDGPAFVHEQKHLPDTQICATAHPATHVIGPGKPNGVSSVRSSNISQ
jgi:hypothetical protein